MNEQILGSIPRINENIFLKIMYLYPFLPFLFLVLAYTFLVRTIFPWITFYLLLLQ